MAHEVKLERILNADIQTVFSHLVEEKKQELWWCPPGVELLSHNLDFALGEDWFAKMQSDDGIRFYISGKVNIVNPPHEVEFTWGWHDETGNRGEESIVRFELEELSKNQTLFTLKHTGLPSKEMAINHKTNWEKILDKLSQLF